MCRRIEGTVTCSAQTDQAGARWRLGNWAGPRRTRPAEWSSLWGRAARRGAAAVAAGRGRGAAAAGCRRPFPACQPLEWRAGGIAANSGCLGSGGTYAITPALSWRGELQVGLNSGAALLAELGLRGQCGAVPCGGSGQLLAAALA